MRKPIILYNTSIEALLQKKEQYLRKLKNVFDVFEDCKDVVLLWRPHPLFLDTIKAMLPELQDEYINLVNWYKERQIGIYDDTTDLDRAMTISDAYYGDGSSLVELYDLLNKPILIQNSNVIASKYGYIPRVALITMRLLEKNELFCVTRVGDGVFIAYGEDDMQDINIDDVKNNDKEFNDMVVHGALKCRKELFIVIYDGAIILKYNWEMKQKEYIYIEGGVEAKYELFKDEESVYIIDKNKMNVYRYDSNRNLFRLIKAENRNVELECKKNVNINKRVAFYDKKNILIYIYDIKNNSWLTVNNLPGKMRCVLATEEEIWAVTERNQLYIKKNIYSQWERIIFSVPYMINKIVSVGEFVKVYFNRGDIYLEVEKKTMVCREKRMEMLSGDYYHIFSEIGNDYMCVFYYKINDGNTLWQDEDNRYSILNLLNDTEENRYNFFDMFSLKYDCSKQIIQRRMKRANENMLYEEDKRTLRGFLKWVCMQEENKSNVTLSNCGKEIHNFILKLI